MDKCQKTVSHLIIAGSDVSEILQLQEEGLYQVTILVEAPIHIPGIGFIALGRDTEISTMVGYVLPQFPLAISFVGQYGHSRPQLDCFQQLLRDLYVMYVPSGKLDMAWVAKSVHDGMNLGASAAPADTNALILLIGILFRLLAIFLPPLGTRASLVFLDIGTIYADVFQIGVFP